MLRTYVYTHKCRHVLAAAVCCCLALSMRELPFSACFVHVWREFGATARPRSVPDEPSTPTPDAPKLIPNGNSFRIPSARSLNLVLDKPAENLGEYTAKHIFGSGGGIGRGIGMDGEGRGFCRFLLNICLVRVTLG